MHNVVVINCCIYSMCVCFFLRTVCEIRGFISRVLTDFLHLLCYTMRSLNKFQVHYETVMGQI